jgi:UDP-glucose 4-epimerase
MKVVITGGAGYLGSEISKAVSKIPQVNEVLVYDNLSRGNFGFFTQEKWAETSKIHFICGDILDSRNLRKSIKNCDWLIHLAAKVTTPFSDENPHQFDQINHWGSAEIAYAAEEEGVKNLVYMSSASVYGASNQEFEIHNLLSPKTFYGISKMRGEQHILRLQNKLPVYVLRCSNVFGITPSARFDAVVNKFLFEAKYIGKIAINGSGLQQRSFIEISEVGYALVKLITEKPQPDVYHLVSRVCAVGDIAAALKELIPQLDLIFINHSFPMRQSILMQDERLVKMSDKPILEALRKHLTVFGA